MKILVTGASGFLGKYVVSEALARGHEVAAMVRPASSADASTWHHHPSVSIVRGDLRSRKSLAECMPDADAVLHLAADKIGDYYAQFAANVVATENLLDAVRERSIHKFIAISTFSVYDFINLPSGSLLTEDSPLVIDPAKRDDYAKSKLAQEIITREFGRDHSDHHVTILRPGVIYGRESFWTARLGAQLSDKLWLRIGAFAILPLAYVENCAEAILDAAESDATRGEIYNIVDDDLPTQQQYIRALAERMAERPRIVPINWTLTRFIAACGDLFNRVALKGQAKVPGVFVPERLHARCKPLRYTNRKLKNDTRWTPRFDWRQSLDRIFDPNLALPVVPDAAARAHRENHAA